MRPVERIAHIILMAALLSLPVPAVAQGRVWKSHLSVGVGKPVYPDMDINENGFVLTLNYRRIAGSFLNWGFLLLRSSADSELDFFGDRGRMLQYLNASPPLMGIGTTWGRIETYAFGGQLHVAVLNTGRHFLSIGSGIGMYVSRSSLQGLEQVTEESIYDMDGVLTGFRISDMAGHSGQATRKEPFLFPALTYQFAPTGGFTLGLEAGYFLDMDSEMVTSHPVLASFYSLSATMGWRF